MPKITHAEVRMYRMGTGDCFVVKFYSGEEVSCKVMIDAGTWSGSKDRLQPYIENLKEYVDNYVDVLVVTHEHKDHVHAFDVCEELFIDERFEVGELWLGWTENDRVKKVKEWKEDYGEKKKALGIAAEKLAEAIESPEFQQQFAGSKDQQKMLGARKTFSKVLNGFAELHMSVDGVNRVYKGGLAGMDVVKKKIKKKEIKYFKPGDVIRDLGEAEGVKVYVLGPPELYDDVKKESGGIGESYEHNKFLKESGAFGAAVLNFDSPGFVPTSVMPFDEHYTEAYRTGPPRTDYNQVSETIEEKNNREKAEKSVKEESEKIQEIKKLYDAKSWRKIDFDWLFSAGSFALRMNGLTNNLSLALAFEFEDSGRVMLFPGDAEFGSWSSWHNIEWKEDDRKDKDTDKKDLKHLTEDLLNRTVFYKVAHHLSHNGTAEKLGLEMMKHRDLAAMATLDYSIINDGWTSTMPNRALLKELLLRTRGRLMIMNDEELFFDFNEEVPLKEKVEEARSRMTSRERKAFQENFKSDDPLFLQYTVKV